MAARRSSRPSAAPWIAFAAAVIFAALAAFGAVVAYPPEGVSERQTAEAQASLTPPNVDLPRLPVPAPFPEAPG